MKIFFQFISESGIHITSRFGVAEFTFGLSFELRLCNLNRNDSRKAFANIVRRNLNILLILGEQFLCELGDHSGEACLKACNVRTTVMGVNVIHKAKEIFLIPFVVPHGNFKGISTCVHHQVDRGVKKRLAMFIHKTDKCRNATWKTERFRNGGTGVSFIRNGNFEPTHQEREFTEASR